MRKAFSIEAHDTGNRPAMEYGFTGSAPGAGQTCTIITAREIGAIEIARARGGVVPIRVKPRLRPIVRPEFYTMDDHLRPGTE
jgi:hypothetical protein